MADFVEKPVPDEPTPAPAMDHARTEHTNLAPQGQINLDDETPESKYTPEGDQEPVPNIPPSITDPIR
jgi:hypothetical protein